MNQLFHFNVEDLTQNEQIILTYIEQHLIQVESMTIQQLAAATHTSTSSISRLSKKLGFANFQQLKISLAKQTLDLDQQIYANDTLPHIGYKLNQAIAYALTQTLHLIQYNILENAMLACKQARRIYLMGVGASGIVCSDLYFKLSRIGKNVIYNQDIHVQLATLASITKQDVLLAVSYSGHTKEIQLALSQAKKQHATTITITSVGKNPLQANTDWLLSLPKQEQALRVGAITSRDTSLFLTDLLYLSLIQGDPAELIQVLEQSRLLTQQLH